MFFYTLVCTGEIKVWEVTMNIQQYHLQMVRNICQLHIDAVSAYDRALTFIGERKIYNEMANFQHQHIHCIEQLNSKLKDYGQRPQPKQVDIKGYILDGLTAIRSMAGLWNALKSIEFIENNLTMIYDDCLHKNTDMTDDIKDILSQNYFAQIEHLLYIQKILLAPFAA